MFYKNIVKRKNQSGRSMIEMLGVLAIIGVLSAGGIAGYTMAMALFKTNKAMDLIKDLSVAIKTFYDNDFTGLTLPILVDLGKVSSEYLKPGTANTDNPVGWTPFGSEFTVAPSDDSLSFSITMQGVPKNACVKLGSTNWGDSTSFISLTINSSAPITPNTQAQNIANMLSNCTNDTNNTLKWSFE